MLRLVNMFMETGQYHCGCSMFCEDDDPNLYSGVEVEMLTEGPQKEE